MIHQCFAPDSCHGAYVVCVCVCVCVCVVPQTPLKGGVMKLEMAVQFVFYLVLCSWATAFSTMRDMRPTSV